MTEPIKSCKTCGRNINDTGCINCLYEDSAGRHYNNWQPKPSDLVGIVPTVEKYEGCADEVCTKQEKEFCGCKPVEDKSKEDK